MKRSYVALIAACCIAVALGIAGAASGQNIEVGSTTTPLSAPVCPPDAQGSHCRIVLAQMTAFETKSDGNGSPTLVSKAGVISALSVGVSAISTNKTTQAKYIAGLNQAFGGPPQVRLTVLRSVGRQANQRWQVAAQSPSFSLSPYLGSVVEFPLINPIPVVRGEVLALTSPTWAPVLSIELDPTKFAYRQSRNASCRGASQKDFAQVGLGSFTRYGCAYTGTRVEYSATEVTSPIPTSLMRALKHHSAPRRLTAH